MRKELYGILYSGVIQEILTTMFHFYVSAQGCLMRICPLLSFLKMTILRRTATIYVFYFNTALATRQAFRRTTSQTYLITSCQIPNSLFFPTACRFVYHQPVSSVRKYLLILKYSTIRSTSQTSVQRAACRPKGQVKRLGSRLLW